MPAIGQNSPQKALEKAEEQAERTRIKSERAKLNETLVQQRQDCYQKLAVTPCLNDARDTHNEKMRDLKRQEVALNDVQRKRAAADRVKALDERNSPEAQLKRAQDRGKAMEAATRREESQAQRQKNREAKLADAAKASKAATEAKPAAKVMPEQRPGQAARIEKSRQQSAKREKDAQERKAKAAEREAKRKKPDAAGLPMPTEAK